MRAFFALTLATSVYLFAPAVAQAEMDDNSQKALSETQAMLQDPKAVAEYAKTHPDAAKAHANVTTLTGGSEADTAELYKLASEIFANVATDANGNAGDMQSALAAAMKNPRSFASKLTPDQQEKLKSLAAKIESRAPSSGPH